MEGPIAPAPGRGASKGRWALALMGIALPLLLFRLGAKDVWEASEGRPLESAREMRAHGDWLVQYTNGEVDLTKPPLYAWAVGALFGLAGEDSEFLGRLPSVVAALACLGAVFVLGTRIAGPRAGFLAGLALLSTVKFLWQARLAELETLLAAGVLWSYAFFDRALEAETSRARWAGFAAYHASVGFAFAVKGPIALLLIVPGAWGYAAWTGRARAALQPAVWGTAPAFLAVGLAWYAAVVQRDPGALDTFLAYARGDNVGHLREGWYYLLQWPLYALPWTPLAVVGLRLSWALDLPPEASRRARLPVVAFTVTLVLQSILHAKQTHYLIPVVFPMGALLAGCWLDRAIASKAPRAEFGRLLRLGVPALAVVLGADALLHSPDARASVWGVCGALAALAAGTTFVARRGGLSWTLATRVEAAILVVLAAEAVAVGWIVPRFDAEQSSRAFLGRVAGHVTSEGHLGWTVFGSHSDYLWYLPAPLVGTRGIPELVGPDEAGTLTKVRAFLADGGPRFAIVTAEQAQALGDAVAVVERDDAFQRKGRRVALVRGVKVGAPDRDGR